MGVGIHVCRSQDAETALARGAARVSDMWAVGWLEKGTPLKLLPMSALSLREREAVSMARKPPKVTFTPWA
jgi:hypothetical protein